MEQALMWVMAAGALLGGLDRIFGNRFGLGKRFEEGFHTLGPTALSMAGILCLVPLLTKLLSTVVAPLCGRLGLDPAMFAGVLAIDMGGYQLAMDLAQNPLLGKYSGILVGATLGCTVSFTIPVGMGMLAREDQADFAKGILFGLIALPAGLLAGGLMCGLTVGELIWQSLPILILSALLLLGIWKKRDAMLRGFAVFARIIEIAATVGLVGGAVKQMTGFDLIPGLAPMEDGMAVVASIGVVLLGSLPMAELAQRALRRPLAWVGKKTGMNSASVSGLLISMVTVLPTILMVREMDRRGKVVNAAFVVCATGAFAAHLGFTAGMEPSMLGSLLTAKLLGGMTGVVIALLATRNFGKIENV